jgi:hypothetical protein
MSSRPILRPLVACAVALATLAGLGSATAAGGERATVHVWFLQGEQLASVSRPGATAEAAIRQLLAGPTPAETKRGPETYVPAGTPVRSVTVDNGIATVDLGLKFALGTDGASLLARLSQVVHTATGPEGATKVRLLVKGGVPLGMFPGASLAGRPITVEYLETPNVPVPRPPAEEKLPVAEAVRSAQARLAQLFSRRSG